MRRIVLIAVLLCASSPTPLWAQLPAEAINLAKVKILERQKPIDLCPVHLVKADPRLPKWTYKGVEYRGHTAACQSEFEKAPQKYSAAARYQRWENNFIADLSTAWCPVTDEVAGGFLKWERLGLKWESCCPFCNATVSENHFPAALQRLKTRARLAFAKTAGKYSRGAKHPLQGAVRGRSPAPKRSRVPIGDLLPGQIPEGLRPGLMWTVTSRGSGIDDHRTARLAALRVEPGAPPSPFLPPGPFRATWEGLLRLDFADKLVFSARGRGAIRLRINGHDVLVGEDLRGLKSAPLALDEGFHEFALEYASPPSGGASLRLYWEGAEFAWETVPPTAFYHTGDQLGLVQGERLRRGRALFASRLCVRCHQGEDEWKLTSGSMPELHAVAPSLAGVGSRLHTNWLAHWIANPPALRAGARMPALARSSGAGQDSQRRTRQAADLAAYLATLSDPPEDQRATDTPTFGSPAASALGKGLFSTIGCSACHTPLGSDTDAEATNPNPSTPLKPPTIGLSSLRSKWKPRALRDFLLSPQRHHRSTRMPDFGLSNEEADQLASYLLAASQPDRLQRLVPGDPLRGRQLVATLGCLNCHRLDLPNQFETKRLAELEGLDWDLWGCVASGDGLGEAPRFTFTPAQRVALLAFGSTDLSSLMQTVPAEFATRQLSERRCTACHGRDGRLANDQPAVAPRRVPDSRGGERLMALPTPPPLTYTGEQLRLRWLEEFLAGRVTSRVRPWLTVRMPRFPQTAVRLAAGLAADHGMAATENPSPLTAGDIDPELRRLGEQLLGPKGGFSCSKCHSVGARKAQMEVGFGVIDLVHSKRRLRDAFYLRWMMNPTRVLPGTRMPAYTDEAGNSPLVKILDGDGVRQFEAIWKSIDARQAVSGSTR